MALGAAGGARAGARLAAAPGRQVADNGSTLRSTWRGAGGELEVAGGARLLDRTELAPAARLGEPLGTLAHLTDAHVLDAESPARVPFLRRLGAPFNSTFRPQEALTAQVMDGAIRAVNALGPDAVIQGGDLIDNAQENELGRGLALLAGAGVDPDSGAPGYRGVQHAGKPGPVLLPPGRRCPPASRAAHRGDAAFPRCRV